MKIARAVVTTILLFFAFGMKSQDIPPPNPGLVLNIVTGQTIEFVFDEFSEYQFGIENAGQSTFIRIGSIYDWKLQFRADQPIFVGLNNPAHLMELNNVGLEVVSLGTNQDDGSNIINYAKFAPLALEGSDVTILTKGTQSNKGYGIRNSLSLNWEMGTMQGNMNPTSMLDQVLAPDTYTVTIILTLSVY
jgi:hypothetical protein